MAIEYLWLNSLRRLYASCADFWVSYPRRIRVGNLTLFDRCRLLLLCSASLAGVSVTAAPGDLDPAFNSGGRQLTGTNLQDTVFGLAIQPDGKIIAVGSSGGDMGLSRYQADGTLEATFTPFSLGDSDQQETAHSVFLGPDRTLFVTGSSTSANGRPLGLLFKKARINARPAQLASRLVTVPIGSANTVRAGSFATIQQSDGMLVSAGFSGPSGRFDFLLVRVDAQSANLDFDSNFGTAGAVSTDFGGDDVAFGIAAQTDGKLVVAGRSSVGGTRDFALARYQPDGQLDGSFGTGGLVLTDIAQQADVAQSVALQADGKIVIAGFTTANSGGRNLALARYNTDGTLDSTFGNQGVVVTDVGGSDEAAISVAALPTGRIVVSGYSNVQGDSDFLLVRYRANGAIDRSFGTSGAVLTHFGNDEVAYTQALQPDGKLVVAGYSNFNDAGDFALARYLDVSPPSCQRPTIVGTEGDDVLVGTPGPDVIAGLGGNDTIRGLGGNDLLCGGDGNDVLQGGGGDDRLVGGMGDDRLFGQGGQDVLSGGPGQDITQGGNGIDRCTAERKGGCE